LVTVVARTPAGELVTVTQAYRYELSPTLEQANLLRSHIGGTRFAYNALLGLVQENWDANRARKEAGGEVLKEDYLRTGHLDLQKLWYQHRDELAPWWGENNSSTYNYACLNLSKAFTNWRAGRAKFPTRKKRESRSSVSLMSSAVRLDDSHHVRISRVGTVKTYESTRKLYRHLERGTGRIKAATISQVSGKFFIAFTLEVQRVVPATRPPERVVGIDVGLTTLYTGATPNGEHVLRVENPRNYQKSEQKLARAQRVASRRQGPRQGVATSNRWKKANARVQKIHTEVANQRKNLIHETTSMLAKNYDVIVVENLNVKGMLKNHSLAKHISDASWGEFVRQLEYKSKWYGSTLVKADRFYPSTRTCSQCGTAKAKLSLDERTYHCEACGLAINRDHNAAINLARRTSTSTSAGTSSVAGRRGEVRPIQQKLAGEAHPIEASTETPTPVVA
jgi:putative transposase